MAADGVFVAPVGTPPPGEAPPPPSEGVRIRVSVRTSAMRPDGTSQSFGEIAHTHVDVVDPEATSEALAMALRHLADELDPRDARMHRTFAAELDRLRPAGTVHAMVDEKTGTMPCCGRTPFEVPSTDRMAVDPLARVTCGGPV